MTYKKKVLIVSDAISIGGAEVYIKNLINLMGEENYTFKVYGDISLQSLIPDAIGGRIDNKKPFQTIKAFLQTVRVEKPDIIHLNLSYPISCFWIQLISLFLPKIKIYGTLHLAIPVKRIKVFKRVLRYTFKKMKLILVSHSAKTELLDYYGLDTEQMQVIPNWVDIEYYNIPHQEIIEKNKKDLGIEDHSKVGLFIGRFEEQKNIIHLIELCNELIKRDSRWIFYIVGDGSLKENIKNKINILNLSDKVFLQPFTSDTKKYYSVSDAFFLLSKYECAPLTLLESMACGVSPIVSDVGDMKVMVGDNKVIYSETTKEDFISAVEYSVSKGNSSWRKVVEEKYSPSTALERMKDIYEQ